MDSRGRIAEEIKRHKAKTRIIELRYPAHKLGKLMFRSADVIVGAWHGAVVRVIGVVVIHSDKKGAIKSSGIARHETQSLCLGVGHTEVTASGRIRPRQTVRSGNRSGG